MAEMSLSCHGVWVGDHGGCFVCILCVGSGMCHLLGPGSHCPRCWWHLRDGDNLCTTEVGTCLLGPVNPQIKDRSLRARLHSVLHNSTGWVTVRDYLSDSVKIVITSKQAWYIAITKAWLSAFWLACPIILTLFLCAYICIICMMLQNNFSVYFWESSKNIQSLWKFISCW